jgi:hypothetical protein
MENVLQDDSMLELQIDGSASNSLENGSWWAKFIAIVFIIVLALAAIGISFAMSKGSLEEFDYRYNFQLSSVIWIIFAFVLLIAGAIVMLLFSFATKTSRAVRELDQSLLESGIGSLKIYLIVTGVCAIIGLLLTLLGLASRSNL